MLLEILIAVLIGILCGIITGLLPGVHINLVATLLFVNSAFFLGFTTSVILAVFIVSMTLTHTFLDFIPSIFLGAPNDETVLSILPGHRMLLKGEGYGAINLTTIGCLLGLIIACVLTPLFIWIVPIFYPWLVKIMAFVLMAFCLMLIFQENKKLIVLSIFIVSGILGLLTLNFTMIRQPLFPLFTGLFAAPLLSLSFMQNVKIPKQNISKTKITNKELSSALSLSVISSSLVSFLPGVGSAQAAVIASSLKKISEKAFLVLIGAINTFVVLLSFVALYAINKPRSGVAVFVGKFIPNLTLNHLWLFLGVALLVGGAATFLTLFFAKKFTKIIEKVNYKWLCFGILGFLVVLAPIISGWFALIILVTTTALGIICSLIGVKKIFLMGSLLLPVILYYLL